MKKGKINLSRKVRNNKVKKKRKTIKRKSTYKRKKNKKRSIKQKGGNLEKILAVGAGVVLTGALAGVFKDKIPFDSSKKHNKNPTKPQTDHNIRSSQKSQGINDVNVKYYKPVSKEYKIGFIKRYSTNTPITNGATEDLMDVFFITAWTTLMVNLNSHIKFIQDKGYKTSKKCIENLEALIVTFDIKSVEEKNISKLHDLGPERHREIDAFFKSYVNFIIMSIFMIHLNNSDEYSSISYSEIFEISELNEQIKSINPESDFTVKEELVNQIFEDSLEILNDMDVIIKETLENEGEITDEILLDKLSNKYFPGYFNLETEKGSDRVFPENIRPKQFYEQMIKRNKHNKHNIRQM